MTEAKKIIYAKRFDGLPKLGDFKLEKEILPALNDGGSSLYTDCGQYKRNVFHI